jgi:hypothetical protein
MLQQNRKKQLCISNVHCLRSENLQVVCCLWSEQPQSQKKINKNENTMKMTVYLVLIRLHLYDVFGPKRATILNFDALFEYIGFGAIS